MDANKVLVFKAPLAANRIFKVELKVMEYICLTTTASREWWI